MRCGSKVTWASDKLGKIKLGQKVEVTTDTYPDRVYVGKVTYISSRAEFTPKNVQTKEERVKAGLPSQDNHT